MQLDWLVHQGNSKIILLFLGWSCSSHTVRNFKMEGYDVLTICDYRNFTNSDLIPTILKNYREKAVIAWSFGVWAAAYLSPQLSLCHPIIAVNGTPHPIDDKYGIPRRIFQVTLNGIEKGGMEKFCRNMYGWPVTEEELPNRTLPELIDELQTLNRLSQNSLPDLLQWNHAIISEQDTIFPPVHVMNYWNEKNVPVISWKTGQHYPFSMDGIKILQQLLNS